MEYYPRPVKSLKNKAKRKRHLSGVLTRMCFRGEKAILETKTERLRRIAKEKRLLNKKSTPLMNRIAGLTRMFNAMFKKRSENKAAEAVQHE